MSDIIGSLIDGASQILTNRSNERSVANTNSANAKIADSTNQANMAMNAQNIAFQRETNDLNYIRQKAENDLTRAREDTAYSRAASDLESAGLSKTLAAGEPASSASMQSAAAQAPENKFQMQRYEQKAFQANAVKMDLDILESLQKIKNIQSTDLQNTYQNWYNNFAQSHNILPGTSPWYNHFMGINAAGSSIMNYLTGNNMPVGQESAEAIDLVRQNMALTKLGLSPASLPAASTAPETSKGHSSVSLPSFSRAIVNDLPFESTTKKILNDTSTDIANVTSKSAKQWSIPDFVYNPSSIANLVNNSKNIKSYVKENLPKLAGKLKDPYVSARAVGALALLSILGTGSASAMSFLDNEKKALLKFK